MGTGSLSPGDRLGRYEIVGLLGAGGMGEVYRARDPHLTRDVALKILSRSSTDPEHLERFSREARAAGSLNHPNIVAVFDVGAENGVPYVVTELLEGETLHARLEHGPLGFRKAVEYGVQIAHALDAAHAKGICHRDVKPANAFVTGDGRVKLLDFGIAKLTERDAWTTSADATVETSRAGQIIGTAGYMAPEQVLGLAVDHRADIFALGAVLYEMFTGTRAFHRASTVETMTAVLQEEPPDPLTVNHRLPAAAAAIVRRCLEKNREERFQSARDLAFDLQQLREQTGTAPAYSLAPSAIRRRMLPALLAVGLVTLGLAVAVLLREPSPRPAPAFEQLTFSRARIGGARFASQGQVVVYSEARQGNAAELWRLDDLAERPTARPLGHPPGSDVLAARAGELALSVDRRYVLGERFVGTLAVAPIGAGAPRKVTENVEDADWNPAGTHLAVVRSTGLAGGQSWIEYDGRSLYRTEGGNSIRFVRFSRDGQRIAFIEDPFGGGLRGSVAVVDLNGRATKLTGEWPSARGLAWSASGAEVWFTAGEERTNRALRAVDLEGNSRVVLQAPGSLTLWDIAADGRVLLTRDDERSTVVGVPPGETVERDLSLFDGAGVAALSADGRTVLFGDRSGIYLRDTDGSAPVFLGLQDAGADDLSPDGRTVLATMNAGRQLMLVPTGAGDPQPLPAHGIVGYHGAQWFPDGKRILVNGMEAGRGLRSYVQDVDGSPPRAVTPEKVWALSISTDGEWLAATGIDEVVSLWPVGSGSPRPVPGTERGERPVAWSADGRWLWLFRRGEAPAQVFKLEIATGRRQLWKTLAPSDSAGVYSITDLRITPSGNAYFYSYTQLLSQLYLVQRLE